LLKVVLDGLGWKREWWWDYKSGAGATSG
jgi:hypothetical protein